MAVPLTVPEDSHLREPLTSHQEIALVSVSRNRLRKLVMKRHVERDRVAWSHGSRKCQHRDRAIRRIVIVRRNELKVLRQIAEPVRFQMRDGNASQLLRRIVADKIRVADAPTKMSLSRKGRRRLKCVEIKMKREGTERLVRQIPVRQRLGGIDRLLLRIHPGGDGVSHDSRRKGCIRGRIGRNAGLSRHRLRQQRGDSKRGSHKDVQHEADSMR